MSYNIAFDTEFKNKETSWKAVNCSFENGYLKSFNKIFGIDQEITLTELNKLYFRISYIILEGSVFDIKIGIQSNETLNISNRIPLFNEWDKISIVDIPACAKIKIRIIFESKEAVNKVRVREPLLTNLNLLERNNWLLRNIDKSLHYRYGYNYSNIYKHSEIKKNIDDFAILNLEDAKLGSIATIKEDIKTELTVETSPNKYYLIKINFEEINNVGSIYLKYGETRSTRLNNNQLFMIFQADKLNKVELIFENRYNIAYQINLKDILIIDLSKISLQLDDIAYLPFI